MIKKDFIKNDKTLNCSKYENLINAAFLSLNDNTDLFKYDVKKALVELGYCLECEEIFCICEKNTYDR